MKTEENPSSSGKSVKQYAKDVFHECLVTGLPNIVQTRNWKNKIFKICILGLCFAGFLYQAAEFVSFVLTYPSVVDIHVYTPETFIYPAITVCNNNGIKRSKFCEAYPDRCETPGNKTDFCIRFPHYCDSLMDWDNFKVPKTEFHDFENNATLQEMKNLGHDNETLIENIYEEEELGGFQGPRVFFKNSKTAFSCYSLNSRVESSLDPAILQFVPLAGYSILEFVLNFEPNETFLLGREPGGLLAIHSPFELVNPYDNGVYLEPGKIYKLHLKLQEEELLPFPYKSGCVNYTEKWLDNGRTGPRSQEMCKQNCIYDVIRTSCNCTFKMFNVLYDEDTCFTDDFGCVTDEVNDKATYCIHNACSDDCQKYKFLYDTQERKIEDINLENPLDKKLQKAYVHVYATDPEVVVYKYRPHYQNIEVFSYIGGYIGAWLGISLVAVADFFECLFRIAIFAMKKRKQEKENKEAVSLPRL